jgi:magnesium transporter
MNFRYMPELTWRYGYSLVIALMLAFAGVLLWAFHRKGWFK